MKTGSSHHQLRTQAQMLIYCWGAEFSPEASVINDRVSSINSLKTVLIDEKRNFSYWLFLTNISFILCFLFRQSSYYEHLEVVNTSLITMILIVNGLDCKQNEWDSAKMFWLKSMSAGIKTGSSSCSQVINLLPTMAPLKNLTNLLLCATG